MRIISKFHDYYDTVLAHGSDDKINYLRETREVPFKNEDLELFNTIFKDYDIGPPNRRYNRQQVFEEHFIIGFCGKWYTGISFDGPGMNKRYILNIRDYKLFLDDLKQEKSTRFFHTAFYINDKNTSYFKPDRRLWNYGTRRLSRKAIESYFSLHGKDDLTLFHKYKVPIIYKLLNEYSYRKNKSVLVLNPNLKELGFQKIFDPFRCFQEIEMFLSGVLGVGEPDTVEISEKDKIKSKGFDEWSFRKKS